ncbi:MAG: tetratricopeptide repeat protein [Pseudomonadota bacterium]
MTLFEEAVALSGAARDAFVAGVRKDNRDAGAELESLLEAYDANAGFLEPMNIGRVAATLGIAAEPDVAGTAIGAYRIERELARGGMGVVYVARRADGQFDQRVALKLIKRGMDSDEVERRFLNERQILAQLSHPNIARLLDGGITDDGQPFFAMEFVEGITLTNYCDEHELKVSERLQLFVAICRAVQHAHNNLVVHRDIKPSNILVDARGTPKLLDFGIAKLLDTDGADGEPTRTAMRALTPEYASPEQILGEPITTASDIYQLGLLLYRLLTGTSPATNTTGSGTASALSETAPPKPSSAVTASTGARCQLPPRRLSKRLSGDLDNIVLMTLRREPERRYASAGQLAADVERHLNKLPIAAQPDSVRYRMTKFIQRHTVGVAATVLLLLALLAGIAGTSWQAGVAAEEARRASQLRDFTLDLLALSDPDAARGQSLTVSEMLATGTQRVDTELAGQPKLQAQMLTVLGNVHNKLGNFDEAVDALERATALHREQFGDDSLEVAQSLGALGTARCAMQDFAEAEPLLREALALHRAQPAPDLLETADILNVLSSALRALGNYDEADTTIREALALREEQLGPNHPAVADALTELGVQARRRVDSEAAMEYQQRALDIRREALGPQHYRVAESLKNVALVYHQQDKPAQAEARYREALAIQEVALGDSHPNLASTLNSLASLLHAQRQLEESKQLFERSLVISRGARGTDDPGVALTLTNYGALLFDRGEVDESVAVLTEALGIKKRVFGTDHPSTATSLNNLAIILGGQRRPSEAWPLVEEAAGIYRRRLGDDHLFLGIALLNQALFELDAGLTVEAEAHALEAHRIIEGAAPEGSAHRAHVKLRLAEVYLATGRVEEARPLLEASVAQFAAREVPHKRQPESENALGEALSLLGEEVAATELLVSSYEVLKDRSPRVQAVAQRRLDEHNARYR